MVAWENWTHPNSANMVQGKTKGLTAKASSSRHSSKAAATKKGQRYVPPKKPQLIKQAAVKRVLSAASAPENDKLTSICNRI